MMEYLGMILPATEQNSLYVRILIRWLTDSRINILIFYYDNKLVFLAFILVNKLSLLVKKYAMVYDKSL